MSDINFYVIKLASSYESSASLAARRIQTSSTIMDLVHAINSMPPAPPVIKWMPDVKKKQSEFNRLSETKAEELIGQAISALCDLEYGSAEFEKIKGRISMDIRYLSGHTPLALQHGLRELSRLQKSAAIDAQKHQS